MAITSLLDLNVNKVSIDICDYSMMLVAPTGFGKTPFLAELFGQDAILFSFDNSQKGIAGIYSVVIDSYATLTAYINQLQNIKVREKFKVVIIDTLNLMDFICEKSVLDSYGQDIIGDCLAYNKAYKIVDKRFLDAIKKIQKMGYTMVYTAHPKEIKTKVLDANGKQVEIIKYVPQVSDRIMQWLVPEIDVRLFGTFTQDGQKVLCTQTTPYFDARVRVGDMVTTVPFNTKVFKEEFEKGVLAKNDASMIAKEGEIQKNVCYVVDRTFEEVMKEVMSLGEELAKKGLGTKANEILYKELGKDSEGKQRALADATESMTPALETLIVKLKAIA